MNTRRNVRFEDWEAERMQDPEFRAAVEELEPAYQVARLRIMRGLTQKQLAKLVGTKQSSIARLESGRTQPSLSFLRRVVEALGGRLEVRIMSQEEAAATRGPAIRGIDWSNALPSAELVLAEDWPTGEKYPFSHDRADCTTVALHQERFAR